MEVKLIFIILTSLLLHSSTHLIFLPSNHSPSLSTPLVPLYVPLPCYLPFSQYPLYILPSGQVNSPYPCFLIINNDDKKILKIREQHCIQIKLLVILILSIIFPSIRPCELTQSMHFIIFPVTCELSFIFPSLFIFCLKC